MYKTFKIFYNNFCIENKTQLLFCLIFAFISGLLEIIGIASVIPMLKTILDESGMSCLFPFLNHYTWQQKIVILTIGVVVLFLIKNLFMIFYHWFSFKILVKIRDHICLKLLELIQNAKYIFLLKKNSDVIVNTLDNTVRYVTTVYLFFVIQWLVNLLTIIFIVFLSLSFFPITTIIVALYSFLCFLILRKIASKPTDKINKDITKANKDNIGLLQAIIFSIKELKTLKTIDYFLNSVKAKTHKVNYLEQLGYLLQTIPSNIIEILILFLLFLIILVLLSTVKCYQEMVVFLGFFAVSIFRVAPIANRLLTAYTVVKSYNGSVIDLNNIHNELISNQESDSDEYSDKKIDLNGKLQLEKVNFSYDPSNHSKTAIKDINITINKNDFIGIVGLSGAGKTTLVDIILGLLKPISGSYFIDNYEIKTPNQISSMFGYVSQNPCIITGTIASNVALGREMDYERIQEVMALCQLNEFTPESEVVEFGKNISGGQRQRIAIARALYGRPQVLILDEVTSSLDIITEKKISDVIDSLKCKCTIIAIAHRLGTLKKCNRIFYMQKGEIIANDSFENLYKNSKEFKTMVDQANITQKS